VFNVLEDSVEVVLANAYDVQNRRGPISTTAVGWHICYATGSRNRWRSGATTTNTLRLRVPQANSDCERHFRPVCRECLGFMIPLAGRVRGIIETWAKNRGRLPSVPRPGLPERLDSHLNDGEMVPELPGTAS
jgi:hypothetical protein